MKIYKGMRYVALMLLVQGASGIPVRSEVSSSIVTKVCGLGGLGAGVLIFKQEVDRAYAVVKDELKKTGKKFSIKEHYGRLIEVLDKKNIASGFGCLVAGGFLWRHVPEDATYTPPISIFPTLLPVNSQDFEAVVKPDQNLDEKTQHALVREYHMFLSLKQRACEGSWFDPKERAHWKDDLLVEVDAYNKALSERWCVSGISDDDRVEVLKEQQQFLQTKKAGAALYAPSLDGFNSKASPYFIERIKEYNNALWHDRFEKIKDSVHASTGKYVSLLQIDRENVRIDQNTVKE